MIIVIIAIALGVLLGYFFPILIEISLMKYVIIFFLVFANSILRYFLEEKEMVKIGIKLFFDIFFCFLAIFLGEILAIDLSVPVYVIILINLYNNFYKMCQMLLQK